MSRPTDIRTATIRATSPTDAAAIADVHCRAWRETCRGILPDVMVDGLTAEEALASWSQRLDPDSGVSVFGAEVEGAIVGFISVKSSDEPTADFDGMIDTLYIVQAGQGLGLGRALTATGAAALAENGCKEMGVVVHADNPALGFYQAIGGRTVIERTQLHRGQMCPEVLLSWPLPLTLPNK